MPRRIVAKGMDQYADVVLNYALAQLVPRPERCFGILVAFDALPFDEDGAAMLAIRIWP